MSKKQQGFSFIEVLLVLIFLAIVGFAGYYVWHTQQDKTDTNAKPTQSSSTNPKSNTTSSDKYFTISQWGIRAPYSGNLHLEYAVKTDSGTTYASLSTAEVDSADSECKSNGSAGGAITRIATTDHVLLEDGSDSNQTPAEFFRGTTETAGSYYIKIGNYYYWYTQPQGLCGSDSQSSQDAQSQAISAFEGLMPKLQSAP